MSELPTGRGPLDLLADLAVYAPLGLALTVAEAVPSLARKGRSRAGQQFALARSVGQFAVNQGARQARSAAGAAEAPIGALVHKLLAAAPPVPFAARGRGSNAAVVPGPPVDLSADPPTAAPAAATGRNTAVPAASSPVGTTGPVPSAAALAIPSYDSLSAPQVVQRLAGLAPEEVRAVRIYEAATRGRRTIIARADQLLA